MLLHTVQGPGQGSGNGDQQTQSVVLARNKQTIDAQDLTGQIRQGRLVGQKTTRPFYILQHEHASADPSTPSPAVELRLATKVPSCVESSPSASKP